jgi:hypothetical protein
MKPHKWAKEIKAWADGAEIEVSYFKAEGWTDWQLQAGGFIWYQENAEYRIKPQPKEQQYLYVLREQGKSDYWLSPFPASVNNVKTIGKIKLEVDDEK